MSRPTFVHLTPTAAAEMLRRAADGLSREGFGARIFAWRRVSVIGETNKPPRRLLPIDRQVSVEDRSGSR